MSAEVKKKSISFSIQGIEVLDKRMTVPLFKDGKPPEHEFKIGLEIRVNENEKTTAHALHVTITDKNDKDLILGALKVACIFNILNFEKIIIKAEGGKLDFPEEYLNLLTTITIGTVRGVMYSEFRGTFLHNAILPILDVKSFTSPEP
jgi:hypothetical protein